MLEKLRKKHIFLFIYKIYKYIFQNCIGNVKLKKVAKLFTMYIRKITLKKIVSQNKIENYLKIMVEK